nr:hypothetical protein [uncultured Desulfobacter sp.]
MKIVAFIEELYLIEKILRHLELWDIRNHDPPESDISDFIPDLVGCGSFETYESHGH